MGRRRHRKNPTINSEVKNKEEVSYDPAAKNIYGIDENDLMGRYVSATENLEAGEILLEDEPLAVGPTQGCPPLCTACYTPIDLTCAAHCQFCKWPLCKATCENLYKRNGHSTNECEVLRRSKEIPTAQNYNLFNVLLPLRILLLKLKNEKGWEIITTMESHNKFRQKTEQWILETKIMLFMRNCLSLNVSEDEIHTIFGYIQVNSFGVEGRSVSVLYPTAYLLSHDCIPNTTHIIDKEYRLTLRSTVPVKKGELLTISYCNTLQGTLWRRIELRGSKFFDCTCKRCSDKSEYSTNMSAVKCEKCKKGYVLPTEPLDYNSDWMCNKCNDKHSWNSIYKLINGFSDVAEKLKNEDIPGAEKFLEDYKNKLHPHHFVLISIKLKLSQMYGKVADYVIHTMNEEMLMRKRELCKEILDVLDNIEPGLSRIRGVTLYELHAPTLLLASLEFKKTNNKKKFQNDLKEVINLLSEARHILSFEVPDSPEGLLGKAAAEALHQMKM